MEEDDNVMAFLAVLEFFLNDTLHSFTIFCYCLFSFSDGKHEVN